MLERVANPHPDTHYLARFTAPEFTSLCPVTGQPDFAHLVIDYVPGDWLVESKSLKLYLGSFRNHGAFHEDCTVAIGKRLVDLLEPKWLRIGGYWYPRGGMPIDVFWQTGTLPEGRVAARPGRRALSRAGLGQARSFDRSCGAKQDRCRHLDAQRLRGFEIHDQFERGRLLDRKIGRIFAAQYPVGVGRQPQIGGALVGAVAQETAGVGIFAPTEHRRQLLRDGELGNFGPVHHGRAFGENDHRIGACVANDRQRPVQFACADEWSVHDSIPSFRAAPSRSIPNVRPDDLCSIARPACAVSEICP